jgi:hypothetical protein
MRNGKAIEGFMDACLETTAKMGFQRSELDKLLHVLVVTRADLSARSSLSRQETKYAARLRPESMKMPAVHPVGRGNRRMASVDQTEVGEVHQPLDDIEPASWWQAQDRSPVTGIRMSTL